MTVFEQSFDTYPIDTPLSEESDTYLYVPEMPVARDPIQQRMLIILGFVAIIVIGLSLFLRSQLTFNGDTQTAAPVTTTGSANNDPDTETAVIPGSGGSISPVFSPQIQHWAPQITAWASQHGLDPDIVATIMQIESCGDPQAISSAGAQGLFQVMPFHFRTGEVMLDPNTNAARGLNYYAERLQQTNGNVFQAFAGYNGGHVAAAGSWESWPNETQRYYTWSKGIYEDAKAGLDQSPTLQQWMAAGGSSLCQQANLRLGLQ